MDLRRASIRRVCTRLFDLFASVGPMVSFESVIVHAERFARAHAVPAGDPRVREIERLAWSWVREGMAPRRAVEMAGVLVLRLYGQARTG